LLAHDARGGVDEVKGRGEVGADHRVPVRRICAEDRSVAQDGGIVHDDVDAAEGLHREVDELFADARRGDAFGEGESLPGAGLVVQFPGGGARHLRVATVARDRGAVVGHDDLRALGDQRPGDGPADAAAGAGDDGDPSVQQTAHCSAPVFLDRLAISAAV
jgi:hypothetical protein